MPNKFVVFNGVDQNNLASLWITDGTSAGTSEIAVTGASANGLNPMGFAQFGSEVAFEGNDASGQNGLWVTDGTSAGTSEISVTGAAASGVNPQYMTGFGNQLLFEGVDAAGNSNLWVSDGTSAGTSELSIAGAATTGLGPQGMTVFGNEVLFGGFDSNNHFNLWVTDGTAAGTSEVQVDGTFGAGLVPEDLTPFGNKVLLNGVNQAGLSGLWVTDGTAGGTSEIAVAGASPDGLNPLGITVFGDKALFEGVDASGQTNLWVTDGTAAGTSELAVANAFSGGLNPFGLTVLGNEVFFEGEDSTGQYGLWKTDGTSAGTSELSIGAPGLNIYLASNGKDVFFNGNYNLWVTDGTPAGTSELAAAGASPSLNPTFMTSVAFPISGATSTLVATPGSVTADGVATTTLTVTVEDAHGNPIAGTAVTLSGDGTANSFGTISGTTNAQGVFTTTLASTVAQTETITATEGSVHETTSVTFTPGAPSATTSTLVATPGSATADGVATTTLTVTVEDAQGNLVPNAAVTLSGSGAGNSFGAISGTTNAQGVFTTTLASTVAQTETITATEGSVHETTSVTFTPGAPSATTSSLVATPGSVTADGVATTTLTVTVEDAQGNLVPNAAVTLSGSGAGNSFGAISGTTNAQGVFTTTLASTVAQTETITATEGSVHETTSVTFTPGAPSAATSSLVASPVTVAANGIATTTLTVTVEDALGNPVPNTAVTLSSSGAGDTFGATSGTTNAQGVFVTTLSSTTPQVADTITASEGGAHESTSVTFSSNVIEAFGSTSLVQVGHNFYLDSISTGTGPEFKYGGAPVTAGEFGAWTFIGAEKTAGGYEVALHLPGSNQYTVWNTDSTGNVVSNATGGFVTGTSSALESLEPSFHQDLNGDGVIGVPSTTIEALGSTSLVQVGNNFYLDSISTGTGPEFKYGGTPVTAGEFGAWTFIGAEKTASGYEVALHLPGSNQYTVWNTDNNGNVVSNATGGFVAGTSSALEALESSFHQDLNGDGAIGVPSTTIESFGSTSLVQVSNNFYLDSISTGTGPEFKYAGTPVTVGEFGTWTFIGAEKTASGYEVALHLPGSNQYTVWNTDNNGNVVSNGTGGFVTGTSSALESLEPSFHQDLNGDGAIGVPSTTIESFGSTSLVQVNNNFFLDSISTGTGPEFKYAGTPVTAGEFGAWTFIGAEQTASGYEVALHLPGSDQYTVWNTNASGNVVSNATGGFVSGTSSALESLEPSFHQDLNGDGVIGGTTIATGATTEIPSASSAAITFAGSTGTLQLDSSNFTGTVAGLNGLDTIDLTNINPATVSPPTYIGNSSGGTLSVTDGTHTTNIALLGNYLASTFAASSDGHGGTSIVDPLLTSSSQQTILTQPQHA